MTSKLETLKISRNDVKNIIDIKDIIDAVESAFKQFGDKKVQMPPKAYLYFNQYNGDYRTMPGYLEDEDIAGCKLVNSHPENKEHPTVMAVLILVDTETGYPYCIMDATELTAYRTGAAGGVAAKYLSRENSETIGLVGAGVQAITQLKAVNTVRNLKNVKIYDIKPKAIENLKKQIQNLNLNIKTCKTAKEAVTNTDIVITTTPVKQPIVKAEWISPGTHINAIGADAEGKQELETKLLKQSKVVVDDYKPAVHGGEVNVPITNNEYNKKEIHSDIGKIVNKTNPGRTNKEEITIFDSTGLAVQDIASGWKIYQKAKQKNIGQTIKLI
ncbi:Alanine dehydrogenase/(1)-pyrroline-2-carboxylate reductase ProC [Methanonatronarchaeum thermophilum]|uniref:Alanine dehydrogenase n=1 Tax=Methanonatronarchaeum thermophilum TaxID=1927129 RepID=A0A1Y3G9X7_9EURY|nr:alanine dehydrogenase [Methanonatronarchaeum thermophilum]OUJ18241.1 Alanine dehydrogenase/(1)-pyrroline-2-carboxylate reductase ProC [Methanonatronarchaeum thermophilum]